MATELARGLAAQAWCDKRTSDREMDVELAEVFAEILDKYLSDENRAFHAEFHK